MVIEERLFIAAPARRVWGLVADPARMAALSPEVERVDWTGDAVPQRGSTFEGHNRVGPVRWSTTNIVEVVASDRAFGWRTVEGNERCVSRWAYRVEHREGGCEVVERYETVGWMSMAECLLGRAWMLPRGMRVTLQELKIMAESGPAG
ncbi:MAG: SRPBCC family protein [Nocardioidaceae bacterium]